MPEKWKIFMEFLTLDSKGAVLAIALGVLFFLLGLDIGYYFILTMALFLVLSAIVTSIGMKYKKAIGIYEPARSVNNVIANGLSPLIMALIYFVATSSARPVLAMLAIIGFTASVAAITADKFASELGVLGSSPHMIFTNKKVRKGTSGGITALGLAASLTGAAIIAAMIALVAAKLHPVGAGTFLYGFSETDAIISVAVAGFIGGLVDSMLGFYEEQGIGNKFSSNFVCSIAGAVAAILVYTAL